MFQLYPKVISYNTRNSIIISLIAIALTIVIISYNVYIIEPPHHGAVLLL